MTASIPPLRRRHLVLGILAVWALVAIMEARRLSPAPATAAELQVEWQVQVANRQAWPTPISAEEAALRRAEHGRGYWGLPPTP